MNSVLQCNPIDCSKGISPQMASLDSSSIPNGIGNIEIPKWLHESIIVSEGCMLPQWIGEVIPKIFPWISEILDCACT